IGANRERLAPIVTNCLLKDRSKRWSAAQVIEYLSNRQNTTIAPKASSTPQPVNPEVELKSDVGMDYNKLRDLLKAEKWQEADEETRRVMLAVANLEEESWLDNEHIDNFPCADLRTIDQLWVKYSNGRFGFSVQKRIYQGLGGTRQYNQDIWDKFAIRVGWLKRGSWLYYKDITFDKKAPEGHLPCVNHGYVGRVWIGGLLEGVGVLFSRVET
ncbi:MAG: GUN4 domain-containing protein, partial [Dolichospermum sp.]